MIRLKISLILIVSLSFFSCGTSVMMSHDPGREISKNIRKMTLTNESRKYKRMKACEEKFMKRFTKLYIKQQRLNNNTDFTTPFFSSNTHTKK